MEVIELNAIKPIKTETQHRKVPIIELKAEKTNIIENNLINFLTKKITTDIKETIKQLIPLIYEKKEINDEDKIKETIESFVTSFYNDLESSKYLIINEEKITINTLLNEDNAEKKIKTLTIEKNGDFSLTIPLNHDTYDSLIISTINDTFLGKLTTKKTSEPTKESITSTETELPIESPEEKSTETIALNTIKIVSQFHTLKRSEGQTPNKTLLSCGLFKDTELLALNQKIKDIVTQSDETLNNAGQFLKHHYSFPKTLEDLIKNKIQKLPMYDHSKPTTKNLSNLIKKLYSEKETITLDSIEKNQELELALQCALHYSYGNMILLEKSKIVQTGCSLQSINLFESIVNKIIDLAENKHQ